MHMFEEYADPERMTINSEIVEFVGATSWQSLHSLTRGLFGFFCFLFLTRGSFSFFSFFSFETPVQLKGFLLFIHISYKVM